MNKITTIFVTLFLICTVTQKAHADETIEEIKTMCAEKWGSDFRMQKHCRDTQFGAIRKLAKFQKIHIDKYETKSFTQDMINKDPYLQIFFNCEDKWVSGNKTDYRMIEYCIKTQIEAFKELQ